VISVFIGTILRDLLPVILEISLNTIVIVLLKQYTDRKNRLATNQVTQSEVISKSSKKVDRDGTILTIIMSFLSTLQHIVAFMVN